MGGAGAVGAGCLLCCLLRLAWLLVLLLSMDMHSVVSTGRLDGAGDVPSCQANKQVVAAVFVDVVKVGVEWKRQRQRG